MHVVCNITIVAIEVDGRGSICSIYLSLFIYLFYYIVYYYYYYYNSHHVEGLVDFLSVLLIVSRLVVLSSLISCYN